MLKPFLFTLLFLLTPVLWQKAQRKSWKQVFTSLFLLPTPDLFVTLKTAFGIFAVIYALLLVEAAVFHSFWDPQPVVQQIKTSSFFVLFLAITLGPIAEEVFFRGFLQPFFGLWPTSVFFAVLHYGFGSLAEIAAAFTASLVFGFFFEKTKNIYAPMIAHAVYNASSIILVFTFPF